MDSLKEGRYNPFLKGNVIKVMVSSKAKAKTQGSQVVRQKWDTNTTT